MDNHRWYLILSVLLSGFSFPVNSIFLSLNSNQDADVKPVLALLGYARPESSIVSLGKDSTSQRQQEESELQYSGKQEKDPRTSSPDNRVIVSGPPLSALTTLTEDEAPAHRHRRVKRRYAPYNWKTFKSARFKGYQYGFPRRKGRASACPRAYMRTTGSATSYGYSKQLEEYFQIMYVKCGSQKPDCLWKKMVKFKNFHDFLYKRFRAEWFHVKTNLEEMSTCFIYLQCEGRKGQLPFCPEPCKREPCKGKANVNSDKCTQLDYGLFDDDYMCQCERHFEWDRVSMQCRPIDVCKDPTTNPCHRENTELCKLTSKGSGFECQCKPEFTGITCKVLRNACLQNYDSRRPSGTAACGVHGTCRPIKGSNIYSCTCQAGWTDNPTNDWPDCMQREDNCIHVICTNGYCRSSESGNKGVCQCDEGFGGPDCRDELPHWNPWAPWSACIPSCGNTRKRTRSRTCNVQKLACEGDSEDYQACASKVCLVSGKWADWESWTTCSASCAGGDQLRTRECFYNTPHGEESWGTPCPGPASQLRECNVIRCTLDVAPSRVGPNAATVARRAMLRANTRSDGWKPWGVWSVCSTDCGPGERIRTRDCGLSPDKCSGDAYDIDPCTVTCEKHPYSPWSSWSRCSPGQTVCRRSRTCQLGPDKCQGSNEETEKCVNNLCNGADSMTVSKMERNTGKHDAALFAKTKGRVGIDGNTYSQSSAEMELERREESDLDRTRALDEDALNAAIREGRALGQPDTVVIPSSPEAGSKARTAGIAIGVILPCLISIGILGYYYRKKRAAADKPSVHSDQEPGQGQNDVMDELLVGGDLIDMEEDSLSELTTLEELSQRDRFSDE